MKLPVLAAFLSSGCAAPAEFADWSEPVPDSAPDGDTSDPSDDSDNTESDNAPYDSADTATDADHDGITADLDCDDAEPTTYPGAPDAALDEIDQDCDGENGPAWPLGDAEVQVDGVSGAQDLLGYALAACDLDADGRDDLIVSAPFGDGYHGEIGIWYGSDSDGWVLGMAIASADTVLESSTLFLGFDVACADIDGDGHLDVVANRGELAPSKAYPSEYALNLWYGDGQRWESMRTDAVVLSYPLGVLPAVGDVYAPGFQAEDLDGDGAAELIVALPVSGGYTNGDDTIRVLVGARYPSSGRLDEQPGVHTLAMDVSFGGFTVGPSGAFVRSPGGDPGQLAALHWSDSATTLSSTIGQAIIGDGADRFGSVLTLAEFDGLSGVDGVVAAQADATGGGGSGALVGFSDLVGTFDADGGLAADLRTSLITGTSANASLGATLAAVGDINGDGFAEIVSTEPGANGGAGRVWLLSGASVLKGGTRSAREVALATWSGEDHNNATGEALAVGDFDGDGAADIAVANAAYFTFDDRKFPVATGRAYVLLSSRVGW